ncbi:MAG: hypothetical protein HY619_04325 [Thaumarchaeota archaeon]|nr:hypothetical protein [Nitrososphaerota archaeon]
MWSELYQRFGTELPREFAEQLATIANCSEEEAIEKVDWVTKSYLTDTKPIRTFRRPNAGHETPLTKENSTEHPQVIEARLGEIHISLPASKRDIETARSLLNLLEKKLEDSGKED